MTIQETLNNLNRLPDICLSADATATSNGEGAKTAKVTVVARTGNVIDYPGLGPIVHDFAGMSVPSRIPLDWSHDPSDSNGYLNKFDTTGGDLVATGAIVVADDETAALVNKMTAGVPYQASIQHGLDDDCVVQWIGEGQRTVVNGNVVTGPVTVFREWKLDAVAICKFGADSGTSALLMSRREKASAKEGLFIRFSKRKGMTMSEQKEAVEVAKETADPVVVEPAAEAVVESVPAETSVPEKVPEVVEATKVEPVQEVAPVQVAMSAVTQADPRSEFKTFVAAFGERASLYYSEGLSFGDATMRFARELSADNDELRKRLNAIDRGAAKPITMSKAAATADEKPSGPPSLIRIKGK